MNYSRPRLPGAAIEDEREHQMPNDTITIDTELRERTGTRFAQRLRKTGRLPGVIYGQGDAPTSISLRGS